MNERIKLLAEQAGVGFLFDPDAVVLTFKMEKFAELIVRQCAKIAADGGDKVTSFCISDYFGVEE